MIDHKTPHLQLPLPHPDNDGEDDVLRLRSAFLTIDAKIKTIDALLASDDLNLDTLQEVAQFAKSIVTDVGGVMSALAQKADNSNVAELAEKVRRMEINKFLGL